MEHVIRMDSWRTPKYCLQGYSGQRRRVRPRTQWLTALRDELKLTIHGVTDATQDRMLWRKLIAARAHDGDVIA